MGSITIDSQIQDLELQIQLQESNYRYAMELKKDSTVLRHMRYNIKAMKELLQSLKEYAVKPARRSFSAGGDIIKDLAGKAARRYAAPNLQKRNNI
jgi:hypothetical protein